MNVFSDEDLRSYLRLHRAPLVGLGGDENWWMLGPLQVSKKHATFRSGFAHPILGSTRFVLQEFDLDGVKRCAVVLLSGGKPPAYFAGWVPSTRIDEAREWVQILNEALRLVGSRSEEIQRAGGQAEQAPEALACHFGHEWAPDAAWGEEIIRLSRSGALEYTRRQRGQEVQHLSGRVAAGRIAELLSILGTTAFPEPPERFFPPGASVCTIVTEPPVRKMELSYFGALRLDGYRELLRPLQSLCAEPHQ